MRAFRDRDLDRSTLFQLLKAELASGIFGLRLFIACTAVAALMMSSVWMIGGGLSSSMERNGYAILGGEAAITVVNRPLDDAVLNQLDTLPEIEALSQIVELRSTAEARGERAPVELKAVDQAYPLYGSVGLLPDLPLSEVLAKQEGAFGAAVERTLLSRLSLRVGDYLRLGKASVQIRAVLTEEPDRLSAGGFLVGPRVLVHLSALEDSDLLAPGTIADYRYRLGFNGDIPAAEALEAVRRLTPSRGWELETPKDAGERVRRILNRTTTFLGLAGVVSLTIGLAGAWSAVTSWIGRRARTIALYRLSGATPALVIALHASIVSLAGLIGLVMGLGIAGALALGLMEMVSARLHLPWTPSDLLLPAAVSAIALTVGLAGSTTAALSAAARTPPATAMRSGEAGLSPHPRHVLLGLAGVALALTLSVASLPYPGLAASAALGLVASAGVLAAAGYALARWISTSKPEGFVALLTVQALSDPQSAAMKALSVGIGIAGITAVLAAQSSLDRSLTSEIPDKAPDLVMIDVQPAQVDALTRRVQEDPALGGLQADPYMQMNILSVNGVAASEALVREDKRWVIEGDRSFSWSEGATEAELLAGSWWAEDYEGPPLIAPEEDVAQAFNLKTGDTVTYSVLGRSFTSEVVAIRKEYHRTFRPEHLMLASAEPFRNAPHSWIITLQGETDAAIDRMIEDAGEIAPNVTTIDVRPIAAQVRQIIDGAALGSLVIAGILLLAGALTLASVTAADVDARRREALAFTLIGAARKEIAISRLVESLAVGAIAAVIGGTAGLLGGWWVTQEALHIAWTPGVVPFLVPFALGFIAAISAGAAGGLRALPRGRGQLARQIAG